MGIGGAHNASLQQSVMPIDTHQGLYNERHEAQVLLRGLSRCMQQHARVGGKRPVVVLSATVDACEWFLVKQHTESVLAGDLLHELHEQHVVVHRKVGLLVDGGELKLVGRHLVVSRLARNAQLQGLYLEVFHERLHAVGDGSEVVVVHLLVLRRVVSHERAAREHKVGACRIETLVDKEIFLFPSEVRNHLLHVRVEIASHGSCSLSHGTQSAFQRCFVVECLTRVGNENGGNTKCVVDDEDRAGRVPCAVTTRLERCTNASAGERRSVGLLLHEQFSTKLLHHTTFSVVLDKSVMFLGSAFCQGLEPVCVVCHSLFVGPLLHAFCHSIGNRAV